MRIEPRDIGVLGFCAGLLVGIVVGFSACAPAENHEHLTTIREHR